MTRYRYSYLGFFLLLFSGLFATPKAQASHLMGLDMWYECLGGDTFRIYVAIYGDCSGIPIGGSALSGYTDTWIGNCPGAIPPSMISNDWEEIEFSEVTPVCGGQQTNCEDPGNPVAGVERVVYYADFVFSFTNCTLYTLSITNCCRNNAISNIQNPSSASLSSVLAIDRRIQPCNSSPRFTSLPTPYICNNQPFTFNQGAVDPDGDSLSYRLGPCYDTPTTNLVNIGGTTAFNPIFSSTGVSVNPVTGDITFTPNRVQKSVLCLFVDEWRNGVLLGTHLRDMQITVENCTNTQPNLNDFNNVPIIPGNNNNVDTLLCADDSVLVLPISVIDRDTQNITITWNNAIPGATFVQLPSAPEDSIYYAQLIWPNPVPGQHFFIVSVRDDNCPLNGTGSAGYLIKITPPNLNINPSFFINCDEVAFSANVSGTFPPFNYFWTGDGGLSSNAPTFIHKYPGVGSYRYQVRITDAAGCQALDSGVVNITISGADTSYTISSLVSCVNDTVEFNYTGVDPTSPMQWNFGAFAAPASAIGPGPHKVVYHREGVKNVSFSISKNGCVSVRNRQLIVNVVPVVDAGQDLTFCAGSGGVQLQAQLNQPIGACIFRWTPSAGLSDSTDLNPIANPTQTTTYRLLADCGCVSNTDQVTVFVNPKPTVSFAQPEEQVCFGTAGLTLFPQASGNGPLSYAWSPAAGLSNIYSATPTANPNQSTRYGVVVTDRNGCVSDTAYVFVRVNPIPVADAGPDRFLCVGGPGDTLQSRIMGGGFGSYTYQWVPSHGLNDPTSLRPYARPDSTTIYRLLVTNIQSGCTNAGTAVDTLSTVIVKVSEYPVGNAGPDATICRGESTVLQAQIPANGNSLNYTYQWTPATGLNNPTLLQPTARPNFTTTYTLRVINFGCVSIADSVTISVKPYPTVALDPAVEICPGDSVQLRSTVGGIPGPYSYRWVPAAGLSDATAPNPVAKPTVSTNYTLFAAGPDGCENPGQTILVAVKPMPDIDADSLHAQNGFNDTVGVRICQGNSTVLPASLSFTATDRYTLEWVPATGLSDSLALNPVATPLETTVYYLTISRGPCVIRDSIRVVVLPQINAQASADSASICRGNSTILRATGGLGAATYQWWPAAGLSSTNNPDVLATPDTTTTYFVRIAEGGCIDTAQVTVVVRKAPTANFRQTTGTGCLNLTVSFENLSRDATSLIWDFGDGTTVSNVQNPTHTYAQPGSYTVTLTVLGSASCGSQVQKTQAIDVFADLAAAPVALPDTLLPLMLPNTTVQFTANAPTAVTHLWTFGDGSSSTLTNPTHTFALPGNYPVSVVLTDAAGCSVTRSLGTYVVQAPEVLIANVFTPNGDGIQDVWSVQYTGVEPMRVLVYDRWGIEQFTATSRNEAWNGLDAPEGVYYYVVEIGEKVYKGNLTLVR